MALEICLICLGDVKVKDIKYRKSRIRLKYSAIRFMWAVQSIFSKNYFTAKIRIWGKGPATAPITVYHHYHINHIDFDINCFVISKSPNEEIKFSLGNVLGKKRV